MAKNSIRGRTLNSGTPKPPCDLLSRRLGLHRTNGETRAADMHKPQVNPALDEAEFGWIQVEAIAGRVSTGATFVAIGCAGAALLTLGASGACAGPAAAVAVVAGGVEVAASLAAHDADACKVAVYAVSSALPGPVKEIPAVSSGLLAITHAVFSVVGAAAC